MHSRWIPLVQHQQLWAQYNDSKRLNENMILLDLIRITNVLRNTCWTLSHIGTNEEKEAISSYTEQFCSH